MAYITPIGKIIPKRSLDIKSSRLGIGFEKLDRDVFDPEKAYDKLALVGVKWVRLQSGWQRTEREKGVYNFAWLDRVVDELIARGMRPWICLCYGNDLYTESAKQVFGAVGCPPIFTDEEKTAWANYVRATVRHFAGRVTHYEIWNEPDGKWCWKHGVSAEEYGRFAHDTAKAIREVSDDAFIIGGSVCMIWDLSYMDTALSAGMAGSVDAVTFHEYTADETALYTHVPALEALIHLHDPKIRLIQGESGSQSRSDGCGALAGGAWTPERQAKQCLRHAVADLSTDVLFSSYFSCMDMIEALNGKVGDKTSYLDYGYFGILGADFDENGFSSGEYSPKPSYYAYQNLCSVFAEDPEPCDLPIVRVIRPSASLLGNDYADTLSLHGFRKPGGSFALAYWAPTPLLTTTIETTVSFRAAGLPEKMSLVDLIDGTIYDISDFVEKTGSGIIIKNIPAKDYPMLLTFGDFID